MKTILLMAQSLDGKTARHANHFPDWTGTADKRFFARRTRTAGVVIMGSRTFDTLGKPLAGRKNVVLSRNPARQARGDHLVITDQPPEAILAALAAEGFQEAVLAGGATINSLFARRGLIDEILVTLAPYVFGRGVSLFDDDVALDLKLLKAEPLDDDCICLHYRVLGGPLSAAR
jgi:dihydrofolate reductase